MFHLSRVLIATLVLAFPLTGFAQDRERSLADIRQELEFLNSQMQELRSELASSGAENSATTNGPALLRLDAIEEELRRLTGQVEKVEYRVNQVVKDGTNRISNLEFRLVELEGGDVTQLGRASTLGGDTDVAVQTPQPSTEPEVKKPTDRPQLAVAEQEDFDAGFAAYQTGDYVTAADRLLTFSQTYPSGPLTGDALYWRGEALASMGDWGNAARSFLDSFSGMPSGDFAPKALQRLGASLGHLGKVEQACATLAEVSVRYPNADAVADAQVESTALGCS